MARKPASDNVQPPRKTATATPPTSTKPRGRKLFFAASLSLLSVGAGAYGYFAVWPDYICRQCEARAVAAVDADVEQAVARVAGCGPLGTIALTRLLTSQRSAVSDAALAQLAARCRGIRDAVTADRPLEPMETLTLEALADGLDELARNYSTEVPAPVADFAWDVLEMTGRMTLEERVPMLARGRLTTAADQLLQRPMQPRAATVASPKPKPTADQPPGDAAAQRRLEAQRDLASLYALPMQPLAPASEIAPGALPTVMPAAPLVVAESAASSSGMSSGGMSSGIATIGPGDVRRSSDNQNTANAAARINPIRDEATPAEIRQVSTAPSGVEIPMPAEMPTTSGAALQRHLTTRTAWALLGDLQSAGTPQASAAAAELHRRGFSLREIEIGKHLTSPDAAERTKYTEQLPSSGIAVKPWLLYLCRDPDVEVRRAAVAIMATSNDPELRAKLRELAIGDADELVRDQAAKSARPATLRGPNGR